jgi:hypothetical protein
MPDLPGQGKELVIRKSWSSEHQRIAQLVCDTLAFSL